MNKYFLETPASYFESINNFNYETKFITNLLDSEELYKKLVKSSKKATEQSFH